MERVFIAKDKEGNNITIEEAVRGGKYFCPICGGAVIVKAKSSEAVREHFAHKNKTECDSWNYDMSDWHRKWQNSFPKECQEVVVQKDGIKHRADVLINNTVIEFQHSPITAEEIAERNRFYAECGHKVVWVFDAEGKIKNKNESVNTLDPCLCAETDLCWKRPKREFSIKIPENVTIYLQYRTSISNLQYAGQEFDILLEIKSVDSRQIVFYKTFCEFSGTNRGYYIISFNFLKEYGVPIAENIPSITEIKQIVENWRLQLQQLEQQHAYQQQSASKRPMPLIRIPPTTVNIRRNYADSLEQYVTPTQYTGWQTKSTQRTNKKFSPRRNPRRKK